MNIAIVDTETVGLNAAIHGIWEVGLILHGTPPLVDVEEWARPQREFVWQLPVDMTHGDPAALQISRFYERRWRMPPIGVQGFLDEWFSDAVTGYSNDQWRPNLDAPPTPDERYVVPVERLTDWATRFAALTANRILVGANPSFDEKRLAMLMRSLNVAPAWHYRPICVETLAAGFVRGMWEPYREQSRRHPGSDTNDRQRRYRNDSIPAFSGDGEIRLPWSSTALSHQLGIRRAADSHTALGDCRWVRDLWVRIMEDA